MGTGLPRNRRNPRLTPPPAALLLLALAARAQPLIPALDSVPWNSPYVARAGCEPFIGGLMDPWSPLDEWSYRCLSQPGPLERTDLYFANDQGQVVLEAVRWRLSEAGAIEQQLTARYAKPLREVCPRGTGEDCRRWNTPSATLLLTPMAKGAWDLTALTPSRAAWLDDPGASPDDGISLGEERLRAALPETAPAGYTPDPVKIAARRQVLLRNAIHLLEQARSAAPEQKALLLVAADGLVDELSGLMVDAGGQPARQAPDSPAIRRQLAGFDVKFGSLRNFGAGLMYNNVLLCRAAYNLPDTEWGAIARVRLLNGGIVTLPPLDREGCSRVDQFGPVIDAAELYLGAHRDNPLRKDLLFLLAQCYETWWSATRATPKAAPQLFDEFRAVRPRYAPGAAQALRNSIAAYEEIITLAPDSKEARAARRHLPRLKLGLDTGSRFLSCLGD